MINDSNPFEQAGIDSRMMDLAVTALKRGRNGGGYHIDVILQGEGQVVVGDIERAIIGFMIDSAAGNGAAEKVGCGIAQLLRSQLTLPEEASEL